MPPFRLEGIKNKPKDRLASQILYCKKEYNEKVKITDWEKYLEERPIDINPYDPNCFRLHNSHYHRLGNQEQKPLISETHDAMRAYDLKSRNIAQGSSAQSLINFCSFNDYICEYTKKACPEICAEEYLSTMQESYQSPYPYEMKRLEINIKKWQVETYVNFPTIISRLLQKHYKSKKDIVTCQIY
ncbi:uncharacterized protein LOC115877551 isoform X2 [Sitophilus oryzae]|uniref:Uncharacterized protein LOC115877551 isoform X2 n=1 Tax=Sitophilus oryzae TaxID=7048 RepID=A0A6J2XFZ9_SITOR|nr:uncharacterized protein LOC115877551 isoform X2 [Sitophilus oryzae]